MPKTTSDQTKLTKKLVTEEVAKLSTRYVTAAAVRETADQIVRTAIREQARTLEGYLQDVDERLKKLESRRS
mgnify:CR=1 FL=1|tara:strand:+ start:3984 stop:4199 length:216 start_codon:yes stop_codon:yes gene_type:complete